MEIAAHEPGEHQVGALRSKSSGLCYEMPLDVFKYLNPMFHNKTALEKSG